MAEIDETAATTYPMKLSSLKEGGYAMLCGKPCKIVTIYATTSIREIIGIDIFTGKKYDECESSSYNIDVPNVTRKDYTLIDIQSDGFLFLMLDDGSTREDLKLPTDEDSAEMVGKLKAAFSDGKDLMVSVVAAAGEEQVASFRENNEQSFSDCK